ncbi:hypothetical protein SAICODRAFT_17400 [Saitoella complicata NRRL Y-17804]|uniref:Dynein light intermediate chain n=1 Tax=Saitoella complicata (strain BCRC 22490 / CBS 7301 / JCM 7358 / NBRC 10748 / NRRL Y-17804) TaxID=698492 RepID=A0A0E9NPE2_SAICN|nr:uncharacterized protein SAICODRAFT_17400 [Saitoella complicata NRRL Y-17804]ODQ54978.1 hypothetical protein SAICODRAFT_17400 [Saitoella complicata NRRL Y-17804]GAO51541.1 hypothetical protein G7K_5640-t1 [Saitoella complicata NRRL Y-17804]
MPDAVVQARPSTAGSTVSRDTTAALRPDAKEEIWSTMLSSVSATKAIPLKNVFILGGGATGAQEFVESLMRVQGAEKKRARQRKHTQAPLTTELALGYTYLDIEEAEHEDILTRLGLYTLPAPAPSYEPILAQAVAASPIPDNLLLILLDWATPWTWLSEIRKWVRTLKRVTSRIRESDALAEEAMDKLMEDWEMRIRNYTENATATATSEAAVSDVSLPLSSGQFDDPLGLPLMVVCHNADKTESIAREANFKDEQFDFIQQYLRTVLLKHGAGLHYTTPFLTETTSALFNAIQSAFSLPTAAPTPKANVIARDAVIIPFGWDSWGKIRVLREGFDVEGVHAGWAVDLKEDSNDTEASAIEVYEDVIKDPKQASSAVLALGASDSITHCAAEQDFLTEQLKILEKKASESKEAPSSASQMSASSNFSYTNSALGPVSFNVGGIQVDADDVDERLRRLKDRKSIKPSSSDVTLDGIDGGKAQTEVLQNFFNSLLTKKANKPTTSGGSPSRSSSKDVPPRSSRSDTEAR